MYVSIYANICMYRVFARDVTKLPGRHNGDIARFVYIIVYWSRERKAENGELLSCVLVST